MTLFKYKDYILKKPNATKKVHSNPCYFEAKTDLCLLLKAPNLIAFFSVIYLL